MQSTPQATLALGLMQERGSLLVLARAWVPSSDLDRVAATVRRWALMLGPPVLVSPWGPGVLVSAMVLVLVLVPSQVGVEAASPLSG